MQQLNKIEAPDIKILDAGQLVRLLNTLLSAEARHRNIDKSGIHVPFEINVKDGGADGQWDGDIEPNDYIPKKLTFYQAKAQKMGPADCASEIHKKDSNELKPRVKEVLEAGGAYVFFCSHPYNPEFVKPRIAEARKALKDGGRTTWETDDIRFLDATLIAQWTNLHASAFAYVCRCTGKWQAVALRDYRHWADDPLFKNPFQSNKTLGALIIDVRSHFRTPRNLARITGPSGLGKTRLGFEVFHAPAGDDDEEKMRKALAESVVYLDMQRHGRAALGWVDQLAMAGYTGVVCVDNCPRKDHNILAQSIGHPDCNLNLLTLDYVPENARSEDDVLQIELTPEMMRDIVPKILAVVPGLSERLGDSGIQRVSEFAHGYPQIAILTAEAGHALDLAALNEKGELANRLLWGYDNEDPEAKEIIRCLAPFGEVAHSGNKQGQLKFVRSELCNKVSDYDFNRLTKQFFRKRVLQKVGDYLMVVPPPLAAALAADWLEDVSEEHFQKLLPKIEDVGLTAAFCRRLRQLDFSSRAQELCDRLMGPGGPFDSAEVLNSEVGSRVFRSLSEVNPLAALTCLERVFGTASPEEAKAVSLGRRHIVRALQTLCWSHDKFVRAARILRAFAAGENEHWGNNATGTFTQLFYLSLSGTRCPAMERLDVLREGIHSEHPEVQAVSVKALGGAFRWGHVSRMSGPEQRGTRLPEEDWRPQTWSEIMAYWKEVFTILSHTVKQDKDAELSSMAADALGGHFGPILSTPLADELEGEFIEVCDHLSKNWQAAKDELRRILSVEKARGSTEEGAADRWLRHLETTDLSGKLLDTVSVPGWQQEKQPDGSYKDLSEAAAIELAEELYAKGEEWKTHLPQLLKGDQQQTWVFGKRCMELDPKPDELFDTCLEALQATPDEDRNAQLLRGMINAVKGQSLATSILDRVASDPVLREDLLIPLSTAAAESVSDLRRVTDLVASDVLPPSAIDHFSYGGISQGFDSGELLDLLTALIDARPDTSPSALHLISAYCYRSAERFAVFRELVARLVLQPEVVRRISESRLGHNWEEFVNALMSDPPAGFVEELSERIAAEAASKDYISVYDERTLVLIIQRLLKEHWAVAWPAFEGAMKDDSGGINYPVVDLLCQDGKLTDGGVPLWELPVTKFREWAEENRELIPYILHYMPLYTVEEVETASEKKETGDEENEGSVSTPVVDVLDVPKENQRFVWHPLALVILELCGKEELLGCLSSNIFSFGSNGSRVPYLVKRKELMQDLEATSSGDLKDVAQAVIRELDETIKHEKKKDTQRAAGIYEW